MVQWICTLKMVYSNNLSWFYSYYFINAFAWVCIVVVFEWLMNRKCAISYAVGMSVQVAETEKETLYAFVHPIAFDCIFSFCQITEWLCICFMKFTESKIQKINQTNANKLYAHFAWGRPMEQQINILKSRNVKEKYNSKIIHNEAETESTLVF